MATPTYVDRAIDTVIRMLHNNVLPSIVLHEYMHHTTQNKWNQNCKGCSMWLYSLQFCWHGYQLSNNGTVQYKLFLRLLVDTCLHIHFCVCKSWKFSENFRQVFSSQTYTGSTLHLCICTIWGAHSWACMCITNASFVIFTYVRRYA